MKENFLPSLAFTLKCEGGYVDNVNDPGGATNKGVTLRVFQEYRKNPWLGISDLKNITDEDLSEIYRTYWNEVKGDQLPAGLDLMTFDFAVNSGSFAAIKQLQMVVAATIDGRIGPETLSMCEFAMGKTQTITLSNFAKARLIYCEKTKDWPYFNKGWTRRISDCQAQALTFLKENSNDKTGPHFGSVS